MEIREVETLSEEHRELLLLADPSSRMIERYIHKSMVFEGIVAGETVSILVLLQTILGKLEIMNLAVKEEKQGQGYGKQLLKFALEKSNEKGCEELEIGTGNSSLTQLGLYQRFGFRIIGVDRDFFVRNYELPIEENGIQCRDLIRLRYEGENR